MNTPATCAAVAESAPARLLLVIGALQAGGAERQLSEMANYWARGGAHVTLATWSERDVPDFYSLDPAVQRVWLGGVRVRGGLLTWAAATAGAIRRLRRLLRELRPDALVSFIDISNLYSLLAGAGVGVRIIVTERTHPAINRTIRWPWRALRRICYRRADCVVAQTQAAAAWLAHACQARVTVIPNSLRPLPPAHAEREPLIVAIGRLSTEKGFDLLLRAFAAVAGEFPQWRLCILGEGAERAALARLLAALGLQERAQLPGEVREVEPWLARAALLVHPSRREGLPNAVLEAMGMGVAVIAADCRAGPAELIRDGVNGRLVPMDDLAALTGAMRELMAAPASREALGREARRVRQLYGQEAIMARWHA